jgi:hypothetical protein
VQWQKEALGRGYEDKEDEARACRRLVLYQQRKPCREE